ncbi:MAG TPA: group II intron reverse transcriptase/maturase [Anaerolineae bacterium]|nr:group II intron reverse transcriptase/maturase [Anaerolineae bacterium]
MDQSNDIRKTQRSFARKALAEPEHRFQDLWHLLCREDWIRTALEAVLTNKGAKTPGIDGVSKADLQTEAQKIEFVQILQHELKTGQFRPSPVRRAWRPKPGKTEKRPLGVLTMTDRVVQELLRMLMEPIWESDFLNCSNGFRPGRQTMDCIAVLYDRIQPRNKYYWVIEGDIRKCFDRINHTNLLKLVQRRIADKRIIRLIDCFLRAGVMEDGIFHENQEGTPQGGVLSPLLSNIYLHELDRWWWDRYGSLTRWQKTKRRREMKGNCILTRYADDFILLYNGPQEEVESLRDELREFLWNELHLELSEEKTKITHATEGFDFLGFHVQWETPSNSKPWLRVTPTRESEQRLRNTIKRMTNRATTWESVRQKIRAINRILRGWGNYYRHVSSSQVRGELDWWVSQRMLIWLQKRHQKLGKRKLLAMYNIRQGGRRMNWGAGEGKDKTFLFLLRDIKHSVYRSKKRGNPYLDDESCTIPALGAESPHLETWDGSTSRRKAEWWTIRARVLQRDGYRCLKCGAMENLEVHHVKPKGGNRMDNLETLCNYCHVLTPSYGRNRKRQSG